MTTILRPGLLVSLRTSVRGGITYSRTVLEADAITASGSKRAKWETVRVIQDPDEYERATVARGRARTLVVAACRQSAFGLLCPVDDESALMQALRDAQAVAREFNASAEKSRLEVNALVGRIADNDAEASRAIASEVRELLESMEAGIQAVDPVAIRDAANRARALSGMLTAESAGKLSDAITEVRSVARRIVKAIEVSAEEGARVVSAVKLDALAMARTAFLDLGEASELGESIAPAARAVELPAVVHMGDVNGREGLCGASSAEGSVTLCPVWEVVTCDRCWALKAAPVSDPPTFALPPARNSDERIADAMISRFPVSSGSRVSAPMARLFELGD